MRCRAAPDQAVDRESRDETLGELQPALRRDALDSIHCIHIVDRHEADLGTRGDLEARRHPAIVRCRWSGFEAVERPVDQNDLELKVAEGPRDGELPLRTGAELAALSRDAGNRATPVDVDRR